MVIFSETRLISCLNKTKNESLTAIVAVQVMGGRQEAMRKTEPNLLTSSMVNMYSGFRVMASTKERSRVYFITTAVAPERVIIARSTKQSSRPNRRVRMRTMILTVAPKTAIAKDNAIRTYVSNY